VEHGSQRELTVYNIRKETAIALMDGTQLTFLASEELSRNEQSLLFHVRHHWWARGMKDERSIPLDTTTLNRPFRWGGLNIAVIDTPSAGHRLEMPDSLDIAIVHSARWKDIPQLAGDLPRTVVLSSSLGRRTAARIRESLPATAMVWDVAEEGAFRLRP
jgi:hypothetical protein